MIKHSPETKKRAVELRREGWSYDEIEKKLEVPKSTLSYWLKSIPLKEEDRKRLYTKQIKNLARGSQSQKERRKREVQKIIKEAEKEIRLPLSSEAYKLFGAALYWAEGSKGNKFEITNSDPHLILFFVQWLKRVLDISPNRLKAKLNLYSQQDEEEIKRFWSELTQIPLRNFNKSYIKSPGKGYRKNNLYYGTIKVYVSKGTDMKHRVFGWIKAVMEKVEPEVKITQKRWRSLRKRKRPVNLSKSKE